MKRKMRLTFPEELTKEPIIYNLGHQFEVVTNIQQVDINDDMGFATLEIEGEEDEIDKAVVWITSRGARIELLED